MPTTAKPTVTDEHKQKYEQIMNVQVKSAQTPPATSSFTTPQVSSQKQSASSIASILSSIPKPKGIGNKMFIFTGKKKIIMDGTQREVENIKTVNPTLHEELQKDNALEKIEKAEEKPEQKEELRKDEKKKEVSPKTGKKKNLPMVFLIIAAAIFIGAWLFFWLVFLGYLRI